VERNKRSRVEECVKKGVLKNQTRRGEKESVAKIDKKRADGASQNQNRAKLEGNLILGGRSGNDLDDGQGLEKLYEAARN